MRYLLAVLLLSSPASGQSVATSRTVSVGSFDRVRVEGPFEVRVTIGSPRATITGDPSIAESVAVRVDGTTLSVRKGTGGWGEQPRGGGSSSGRGGAGPILVTLSTPGLTSASVAAGGRLTIAKMRGMRVDVTVTGNASLALIAADTDQLNATLIGTGQMTLAGRAARARLVTSGPGAIDASGLVVDDLTVHLDGVGETKAAARYTAQVTNSGLGSVTVTGNAKCRVDAAAGGPVVCGTRGAGVSAP
ncbi:GIN domain-containing protein [Sphingomonas faeni]|uniref:GIN domain-containing protein n=1 Tax=Sphingomonas faeni TaxID=185950 RepID=UPI003360BD26